VQAAAGAGVSGGSCWTDATTLSRVFVRTVDWGQVGWRQAFEAVSGMGDNFQLIEIIFFAAIAVFTVLRLSQILGRRTGNERRRDPFAAREQVTTPSNAKGKTGAAPAPKSASPADEKRARIGSIAPEGSELNQALTRIQLADRQFDVDRFVAGARSAYQMVVEAFSKGDKDTLKPLLSDEVYAHFATAIDGRTRRGEAVSFELVSIKESRITAAKLEGRLAEITVTFETAIVTSTKDRNGAVISGDPSTIVNVIDIWAFTRDVKTRTPDWILASTDTAE
jgi:predicted lipid-binding transport protein (Tim44 family)